MTMKFDGLEALPLEVVTMMSPVVAPAGTDAEICVAVFVPITAEMPLNCTSVAPERLVPLIVTGVPTGPEGGEKLVIVGAPATVRAGASRNMGSVLCPVRPNWKPSPVKAP